LIHVLTPSGTTFLVAHSVGSIIATRTVHRTGDRVAALVSIEGNLTAEDAYYSGRAARYDSGERFKADFLQEMYERSAGDVAFGRYFASIVAAHPAAMMGWGSEAHRLGDGAGEEYRGLDCPKLYYWADEDPPEYRRQFIETNALPNLQYSGAGHWPMIDQPERCGADIAAFFEEQTTAST
jgi:pimeloyl-ACP methyl ester carboxylesterase